MLTDNQLKELYKKFHTSSEGLETKEVQKRLLKYGQNYLQEKKRKHFLIVFLEEFKDLMVLLLIGAAVIALIGGETVDAIVILFVVYLNAIIGYVQKFKAEKAIEALRQLVAPKAKVIRDGKEQEIDAKNLVPGDILILQEGDRISADARLIEVSELDTQESILTGESMPVRKLTSENAQAVTGKMEMKHLIFMGTMISHGNGKAIVTETGMATEMGKIAQLTTETTKDQSPLEKEFFRLGVFVGKIALVLIVLLFAIGIFIQEKAFIETLLFATSVAVAAVPEGLPATITIALAIGVQRLAKKNAIVKKLASVETLGSTTVICSDKTGTLTKNEMTMEEVYLSGLTIAVKGSGYAPEGSIDIPKNLATDPLEKMMTAAGLCNNAKLIQEQKIWKIFGDPTEGALLTLVEKSPFKLDTLRAKYEKIHELSFDSFRKRMSVILKEKTTGKYFIFCKGAPDSILDVCAQIDDSGRTNPLTQTEKQKITDKTNDMASRALRTLGFAYRELSEKELNGFQQDEGYVFLPDLLEKDLIFVGLAGMIDPPRPEVKEAVAMAEQAGIRTYVITGDHGLTAAAIAKKLGIIGENRHMVITGAELEKASDEELLEKLQDKDLDIIFARVSPEHKLRIVSLLKDSGEVVAVTGDGVNDAPALKRADIGIAMGITGTDVSKEAANMILTDDSYSTIVTAIREGRTVYENLKKFVFYIFSGNIGELFVIFFAILLDFPTPLTATLILCVDVGTDVLPAVALGIEPVEPGIMDRKPRDPKQRIMNKVMIMRYVYMGIVIGLLVMSAYFWTISSYGWERGMPVDDDSLMHLKGVSMAFAMLVIIQMVNVFNARSEKHSIFTLGFFTNLPLLGAILISLLFTVSILEIPFLQNHLHTVSLNAKEWGIAVGGSLLVLVIEEIRKYFVRNPICKTKRLPL